MSSEVSCKAKYHGARCIRIDSLGDAIFLDALAATCLQDEQVFRRSLLVVYRTNDYCHRLKIQKRSQKNI